MHDLYVLTNDVIDGASLVGLVVLFYSWLDLGFMIWDKYTHGTPVLN